MTLNLSRMAPNNTELTQSSASQSPVTDRMRTKNCANLRLTKTSESGWESSKKLFFRMSELLGVTRRVRSSYPKRAYSCQLRATGSGRAAGKSRRILSFRIERDGAMPMTSMAHSRGPEGF